MREGTKAGGVGEEEAGSQWRREPNEGPNPSDEGTEGKLRTKQKLTPRKPPPPPPWDVCDIPQAFLDDLKDK